MAVRQAVEDAFADDDVLENPPTTEEEWGFLADTVADHVTGLQTPHLDRDGNPI